MSPINPAVAMPNHTATAEDTTGEVGEGTRDRRMRGMKMKRQIEAESIQFGFR